MASTIESLHDTCAPGKYNANANSCLADDEILSMIRAYNLHLTKVNLHPTQSRLKIELIPIDIEKLSPGQMLLQLKSRFESICHGDEVCLSEQAFMNQIVGSAYPTLIKNYRPIGPEKNEWLWDSHIDEIMKQYHDVYPDFRFLGAVGLDCDERDFCVLSNFNFADLDKGGIKRIGIIFNLGKYGSGGSHWTASYCDLNNGTIYYCDSGGKQPKANMNNFINAFKQYYESTYNRKPTYAYNKNSYQKDKSECGVYSCNFIIRSLRGESFEDIVSNPLNFSEISSCRNAYFRNKPTGTNPHEMC
jgi:hypothetical protein